MEKLKLFHVAFLRQADVHVFFLRQLNVKTKEMIELS